MMDGLRQTGIYTLNGYGDLPVYESHTPPGKASINTPQGWQALAERLSRHHNSIEHFTHHKSIKEGRACTQSTCNS